MYALMIPFTVYPTTLTRNVREAVRRKSVANPLQTNYFATNLHACKRNANTKFASDLHIRKSADYIKLANGL